MLQHGKSYGGNFYRRNFSTIIPLALTHIPARAYPYLRPCLREQLSTGAGIPHKKRGYAVCDISPHLNINKVLCLLQYALVQVEVEAVHRINAYAVDVVEDNAEVEDLVLLVIAADGITRIAYRSFRVAGE